MKLGSQTYFLPYQQAWIKDQAKLKICEKSRQIGLSYADSYDSVRSTAPAGARLDTWIVSRDEVQAMQYLQYCKRWAKVLKYPAEDLGKVVVDRDKDISAHCLKFSNGQCIYSLSSNPDAIVGKTGNVKLDEFALHREQRTLYAVAKPVVQWGGRLSIISTHRGANTVFAQIIEDIKHKSNPMGWSLHTIPIQLAVEQGIVERINEVTGNSDTREQWIARQCAECLDEESWLQEYCCVPADETAAFLSYEMITACEYKQDPSQPSDPSAKPPWQIDLADAKNPLYLGMDIGRVHDLTVLVILERNGDVLYTRHLETLQNTPFSEQETVLWTLLSLPQLRRACIDSSGIGRQLAERAIERYGRKVEAVNFTGPVKEELAFPLRGSFEDRAIRIPSSPELRADLRAIQKDTTAAGNIRFRADRGPGGHADRFWALALARHAASFVGQPMECVLV